ncbi:peptide deformylase [Nannocystis sp.]|uniref:peptide deformylase n=1 Tax=Nannocystis sp. TaxID=1962667 RepID=UPI002429403C|nr:peptide deformylase [Nannocystis sp.]MBK7830251.1 peptide deformylase [Nannocystis sp.]MBK9752221.1 peptide deformylase [Nannocystis sp.]
MAILKVAQIGHPILRQKARPVTRDELHTHAFQSFIDSMIETMHDANGAGLAANQVHEAVQVCVMEVSDNPRYPYKPKIPLTILVNPVLTPLSETKFENYEGCLSVPDLRGVVRRHVELRVQAWDRHGNPIDAEVRGITAGTYQHECDHLAGALFIDRVEDPRTLCTWKEFARQHEARFREHVKEIVEHYGS